MHALKVQAGVRYWEDATVNGATDEDGSLIPLRSGDCWCPTIRLSDGVVLNWPEGVTADVHYKVCDAGNYWLLDEDGNTVATRLDDYVPDEFLCPTSEGYGDYIIMSIGPDGAIAGWSECSKRPSSIGQLDGWDPTQ